MLWQLFISFAQIGLFSVGGGYAAIPLIQEQVVTQHGWLTMSEFTDLVTIAEMTPGPIAVNAATFVGTHIAGAGGALIATLGCIFPSLLIVSALALIYRRFRALPLLQSILESLRPAVVALIASAGLTILLSVVLPGGALSLAAVSWGGAALFAAAFFVLRRFKLNPVLVMALCGAVSVAVGLVMPEL